MRIRPTLLIGCLFLLPCKGSSQPGVDWFSTFNSTGDPVDIFHDMVLDSTGNILVTGSSFANDYSSYTTVKLSPASRVLWSATYGSESFNDSHAIAVDGNGNVYVTGESQGECTTIKYNPYGVQVWVVRHHGGWGDAIRADRQGNIYVAGSWSNSPQEHYFITIKYNSQGAEQWVARYGGAGISCNLVRGMALDSQGNIIITGDVYQSGNTQYATIKYDSAGNQLWAVNCLAGDTPKGLGVDVNDNIYVGGWGDLPPYSKEYITVKYNPAGQQQWLAIWGYGGNTMDEATAFTTDRQGNSYITGSTDYGDIFHESKAFATVKYNAAGQQQWVAFWNSAIPNIDDVPCDIDVDENGYVYVMGRSDIMLVTVKYKPNGLQQWYTAYSLPSIFGNPIRLSLDSRGNFYIGGSYDSDPTPNQNIAYFVLKYQPFTPSVTITMTPQNPPITIPASGGSFTFDATVSNLSGSVLNVSVWAMANHVPGQRWYGPFNSLTNLTLLDSSSLTRMRTQSVPSSAPAGAYVYRGYVGQYPAKWDSSYFIFIKSNSGSGQWIDDWTITGEPFPGELTSSSDIHPSSFILQPCSPNPFNSTTVLSFELRVPSQVRLTVYDTAGRLVATLVNGMREAGTHSATFDGSKLASGLYLVRMQAGEFKAVQKMVLLR